MGFSEDDLKGFKESFETFDLDEKGENNLGYIDAKKFKEFIRAQGHNPTEKTLDGYLAEIGKSKIKFEDCVKYLEKESKAEKLTVDDLVEAFKMFDKDGNGYIALAELKHILSSFAEKFTEEELNDMSADLDGLVNYQEFAKMIVGL